MEYIIAETTDKLPNIPPGSLIDLMHKQWIETEVTREYFNKIGEQDIITFKPQPEDQLLIYIKKTFNQHQSGTFEIFQYKNIKKFQQDDLITVVGRIKTSIPIKNKDYTKLLPQIALLLEQNQTDRASEILVQQILEDEHIYTIRDDDKPEIWIYDNGIYTPNGISHIHEKLRHMIGELCTAYIQNKVIFKIQADTYIEQRDFFNNNIIDEIPVLNGLLNLKTRELSQFTPDKIFFTKIPVTYDTSKSCPHIIKFFLEVLKNNEDLPIIQELFGYLLWKEYNIERAFMFIGTGRNGKGKSLELMKRFIGYDNCSSVALQTLETHEFSKCELHNKLANLCGDIDDRALKFTGSFKMLTGRDTISANRKYKTVLHFENYAKMVFAANQLPTTSDLSDGFFMRWILLEFPYTFINEDDYRAITDVVEQKKYKLRDPDIINKITTPEEMSGLLNWALEGLHRLQAQKDFSYSKSGEDVKMMWLRKSDSFTSFCMDTLEEAYGSEIEKSLVRHMYTEYCKKHGLKSVGDKHIKHILTTMYGAWESRNIVDDGNRVFMWVGIKVKTPKIESQSFLN